MHDILFRISGSFAIHSYGIMAMIGFLSGILVARWRAVRVGISADAITDITLWALIGGILGSRVVYVIQNWAFYADTSRPDWSALDLFKIWQGGLVFYGGFIGGAVVTLLLLRAKKLRMLPVVDILAPSLALGQAFGRIGCYLHGCCYGRPVGAGAWYGCVFPDNALPYDPAVTNHYAPGTPLWPTEIVSSLDLFCIFVILSLFFRHRRRAGEVTALYLILVSVERFIIEFYRGDTHAPGTLSLAQWISIVLFPIGIGLLVWLRTNPGNSKPEARN